MGVALECFVSCIFESCLHLCCSRSCTVMLKGLAILCLAGLVYADNRLSYEIHQNCVAPNPARLTDPSEPNNRTFEHGEKWEYGCEDCRCDKNVTVCIKGSRCPDKNCTYVKPNSETGMALPGEVFWDGCRWCKCGARGTNDCHMTGCPYKCQYKNKDGVVGYAQFFQVWKELCYTCVCRRGWSWQIGMGWAEKDCQYDCGQNWL